MRSYDKHEQVFCYGIKNTWHARFSIPYKVKIGVFKGGLFLSIISQAVRFINPIYNRKKTGILHKALEIFSCCVAA
jgi:hypothetical protein